MTQDNRLPDQGVYQMYQPPPVIGYWVLPTGQFRIAVYEEPGWWISFWHYFFLGWEFKRGQ